MSIEIGETFKDLRQASQNKREHNKRYSTKLLSARRVKFRSVNHGYHIIIEELGEDNIIDFWPSTGLWKPRSSNEKQRGIKSLLEFIENETNRRDDQQDREDNYSSDPD